jgi:hypothetical protein
MPGRYRRGWSKEHQQVFKLYLMGHNVPEIAQRTGFDIIKISNMVRTKKFKEHHDTVEKGSVERARQMFEERLLEAASAIVKIMNVGKPDDRIRFDAAKEVLYQCGMKPVEVVETRTRQYTPEEAASALAVVKEIQTIEEKLSAGGSRFIVEKESEVERISVDTSNLVSDQLQTPVEEPQVAGQSNL